MKILKVERKDLEKLRRFAKRNFINTYAHLNNPVDFEAYIMKAFSIRQFEKEFKNPDSQFFNVLQGSKLIAYYKLNTEGAQTEPNLHNSAEIERIYVSEKHKGQGIGREVIQHAHFMSSKCDYIWLGVWERNLTAISFYKKMGFEAFGNHIYKIGRDAQNDILMRKSISNKNPYSNN